MGPVLLKPFFAKRRDVTRVRDLAYGDAGKRNLLDVYHRQVEARGCPVLVYVARRRMGDREEGQPGAPRRVPLREPGLGLRVDRTTG